VPLGDIQRAVVEGYAFGEFRPFSTFVTVSLPPWSPIA